MTASSKKDIKMCNYCNVDHDLIRKTNLQFNKAKCVIPKDVGYLIDYVYDYYNKNNSFNGCWEWLIETYKEQIDKATDSLYGYIKNFYSKAQCKEIVIHHFACETIDGAIREIDIINTLNEMFKDVTLKHAEPSDDYKYGVDIYAESDNKIIFAIQIKPISWYYGIKKGLDYMLKAASALDTKWIKLKQDKGIKCYTVMKDNNGSLKILKNNKNLTELKF